MTMYDTFARQGIWFQYPDTWELTEQPNDEGVDITVFGPETSFWTLSLFFDCPNPEYVLEQALNVLRGEYEELDIYPVTADLCHRPTSACDVEFVCLDVITSAFLRSFQTEQFTALVFYQGTDLELEQARETLDAITDSLQCESSDMFA